jgi:hypothetical protein
LPRGAAFSAAVLGHILVVAAFLAQMPVGLPVELHSDAHPSDTQTPMIATLVWPGTQGPAAADPMIPTLDPRSLASQSRSLELLAPAPPVWPTEGDAPASSAQPAPTAGRAGLRCEVHIHQSITGRVQAIDFGECTGDMVWQHTLLKTIEHAAQLIEPTQDAPFPPVRTLTVGTDNLSAIVLAQQLSSTEMFDKETMSASDESIRK